MDDEARRWRSLLDHGRLDRFLGELANLSGLELILCDTKGNTLLQTRPEGPARESFRRPLPYSVELGDGSLSCRLYINGWSSPADKNTVARLGDLVQERLTYELENEREKDSLSDEIISAYQELNLWYTLGESVGNVTDPDAISDYVVGQVLQILRCKSAGIYLLDAERQLLRLKVCVGRRKSPQEEEGIPVGESSFRMVARNGQILALRKPEDFTGIEGNLGPGWPTPLLAVPMRARGRILGVLVAAGEPGPSPSRRAGSSGLFGSGKRRLLSALGSQAAVLLLNARLYAELRELFYSTVGALADAVDAKDPYTHGHSRRVAELAVVIAKRMDLPPTDVSDLQLAGLLHDVGKIGVPESILNKPGKLTNEEFEQMKQHPVRGAQIVANVEAMNRLVPAILHHHERYDGNGYPAGLAGEEIPLMARILAVADAFDAMTSDRPYRPARSVEDAIEELSAHKGTQFDPDVVDALIEYVTSPDFALHSVLETPEGPRVTVVPAPGSASLRYLTRIQLDEPWDAEK